MPEPTGFGALGAAAGKEVVKPVATAVDALAGPWIARLRRWAIDRELQRRLEDPALPDAFQGYARRLSERVSGLNTVVAREPLPLEMVYEPLSLAARRSTKSVAVVELRRQGARTFVIDEAGMGKSTFARHLIVEALQAEDLVPVFMELRRINEGGSLVEAVSREFDDIDRPFDRDLLHRLFAVGRFLFVLDGLDEVAGDRRRTLLTEIEEFVTGAERSAFVLTTRPETALPSISRVRSLTIQPLKSAQAKSLVRRYDRALGGLDLGERLIREFPEVPMRFLETPLLVALLYRTFGYTSSVSTRISIFYDELYNALYKGHDLTKSGFIRPKLSGLDVTDFRQLLRGFAFLLIMEPNTSFRSEAAAQELTSKASRLTSVRSSAAAFVDDLLAAVPLLVRDGTELRFVHKSIAEFFAAEYISASNSGEQLLRNIQNGPLAPNFSQVLNFLAEIDPSLFRRAVAAPIAEDVLTHEYDESRPIYCSLRLLGDIEVSIWPEGEVSPRPGDPSLIPDPNFDHSGVSYFYGSAGGEKYVCAIATPAGNRIPAPAWELVTEETDEVPRPTELTHSGLDFNGLVESVTLRTWIGLADPQVRDVSDHPTFSTLLRYILRFEEPRRKYAHHSPAKLRVLSKKRARALLSSVRDEQQAHEWLGELLKGSSDAR